MSKLEVHQQLVVLRVCTGGTRAASELRPCAPKQPLQLLALTAGLELQAHHERKRDEPLSAAAVSILPHSSEVFRGAHEDHEFPVDLPQHPAANADEPQAGVAVGARGGRRRTPGNGGPPPGDAPASPCRARRGCAQSIPESDAPRLSQAESRGAAQRGDVQRRERSEGGSAQREQQNGRQHDGRQARIQRVGEQNTPAHPRPAARGTEPRGSGRRRRRRQRSVSIDHTPETKELAGCPGPGAPCRATAARGRRAAEAGRRSGGRSRPRAPIIRTRLAGALAGRSSLQLLDSLPCMAWPTQQVSALQGTSTRRLLVHFLFGERTHDKSC